MAREIPTTLPMANPATASRNEYHTPSRTTTQIGRSEVRLSASNRRLPISHTWGMAMSFDRGRIDHPKTSPPFSGPIAL